MLDFLKKKTEINTTKIVNEIESAVYAHIKPYGFRKHGRTLHRFVSGDISQVIHFQSGMPSHGLGGLLWVNLGIRIPECSECVFQVKDEKKKYYHEYECTIRSRLGTVSGRNETLYNLRKNPIKITDRIIREIDRYVLPVYDVLNSREAILAHRRKYPLFDSLRWQILLDECMIYGHLGNIKKAKELFEQYYQDAVKEYNDLVRKGHRQYLKKGDRVIYMGEDITAEKNGYVILHGADHRHIDYLDKLAVCLGLR